MATDASYAKYVCDQLAAAGGISVTRMFGEYGLYRHGKIVALIADNQFFVKPTPEGEAVLGTPTWGPPYPGARPFFNVSDLLDDADALVRLILATDAALPAPKKKAKSTKKSATKAPTKQAAAKKAPAKKAPAKSAPVKKALSKRVSAKRSSKTKRGRRR